MRRTPSEQLKSGTRALLYAAGTYADRDGTNVRPGIVELMRATGRSKAHVCRHIAEAIAAGWLEQVARGGWRGGIGRATVYALTIPPAPARATSPDGIDPAGATHDMKPVPEQVPAALRHPDPEQPASPTPSVREVLDAPDVHDEAGARDATTDISGPVNESIVFAAAPVRTIDPEDRATLDALLTWATVLRTDWTTDAAAAAIVTCLDAGWPVALIEAAARLCWAASDTRRPGRLSAPMPWWDEAARQIGTRRQAATVHASQVANQRNAPWRALGDWATRTREEAARARAGAEAARSVIRRRAASRVGA